MAGLQHVAACCQITAYALEPPGQQSLGGRGSASLQLTCPDELGTVEYDYKHAAVLRECRIDHESEFVETACGNV
jgi:hypothetical protein